MSSSEKCFPFDGTCELSKDADFTLMFDDESCLKVPKQLLEMASSALRAAIGDCQHEGTLHMPKTTKDTWVFILNFLHPSGRPENQAEDLVMKDMDDELVDVLRQSQLHGFGSLIQDIDRRIAISLYANTIQTHQPSIGSEDEDPVPQYSSITRDMWCLPAMLVMDMPKCEEAMASFFMAVLKENQCCLEQRVGMKKDIYRNQLRFITKEMHSIIKDLQDAGRHRAASLIAEKMFEANLCFAPETFASSKH